MTWAEGLFLSIIEALTTERVEIGLLDVPGLATSFIIDAEPMDCSVGWRVD